MLAEILLRIGAASMAPDRAYHPTPSLAGPDRCIRQLCYHAQGVKGGAWGDRFASVLSDGNWHEELLKDWIRRSAYQLHSEQMPLTFDAGVRISQDGWRCAVVIEGKECGTFVGSTQIHGHIDGILTDLLSHDALLEVKSMDHFKFNRLWEAGEIPRDNLTQVALYVRGAQVVAPTLRRFVLVIKNRNTSQLIDHSGYYDRDTDTLVIEESVRSDGERSLGTCIVGITGTAIAKLTDVESYRRLGTLPARPFEYHNEFPCSYCRWQEPCWAGYEAEVAAREDHLVLPEDMARHADSITKLSAVKSDVEKQLKNEKRSLLALMESAGAKSGEGMGFEVVIKLSPRKGYTVEPTTVQTLDVRRKKEGAA